MAASGGNNAASTRSVWIGALAAAIVAGIWAVVALRDAPEAAGPALWFWTVWLAALLIAIAAVDVATMLIPDALSFTLIGAGLLFAWSWADALIWHAGAAFVGYAAFAALDRAFRALRGRAGLGEGDAIVFAGAGAWLGMAALPSVALIAAAVGIVWAIGSGGARSGAAIPFAPALAVATWTVWLHGPIVL